MDALNRETGRARTRIRQHQRRITRSASRQRDEGIVRPAPKGVEQPSRRLHQFDGHRKVAVFFLAVGCVDVRMAHYVELPDAMVVAEKIAERFPMIPRDQRYCYSLLDSMVGLRNQLAHGAHIGALPSISGLLVRDAELINQLFPTPREASVG